MRTRPATLAIAGMITVALTQTAASAGTASAGTASPTKASGCPRDYVCFWDKPNYQGTLILRQSSLLECTKLVYDGTTTQFYARSVVDHTTRTSVLLFTGAPCGLLNFTGPLLVLSLGGQSPHISPYAGAMIST